MKKLLLLLISISLYLAAIAQNQSAPNAYLGVHFNHISSSKAKALGFDNKNGAYVTNVIENTTAEQNGLQPFDYLTGIDDQAFSEDRSFSHAMHDYKAGDQATLQMIRNGKAMSMPVTFGKQSEAIYRKVPKEEEPFLGVKQDHYNWRENVPGVKVGVVKNSAAEKMNLQEDDIITAINDNRIVDWHDVSTAVDNMKPGDAIKINLLRDGQEMVMNGNIQSYGETYQRSHHGKKKKEEEKEEELADDSDEFANDETLAALTALGNVADEVVTEVDMEDVTQEEADDMKEKVGVDMPIINNLEIERLDVFPNPSNGRFNLTFDLPNDGQTSIQLFNSAGRLIYQNDMQKFSGQFNEQIDISTKAKGIYFLAVSQNGKTITKKIITQ